jgi:acyl-CoA reductase-like NAD-dependent aldehyde dehydrogenase
MTAFTEIDWIERSQALKFSIRNFIGGRSHEQSEGGALEKYSPRDGAWLYRVSAGELSEVDEAVASASRAFADGRWSRRPVQHRRDVLHKLSALVQEHQEELALLDCLDVGKPIGDAFSFDVPASVRLIQYNADALEHLGGKVYGTDSSNLSYQLHRPLGVVAGIIGWNFPLALAAGKIGPALAAGNSLVLKPSEFTSLSAVRLAELAVEAGVPEGVFNVIHGGASVGSALGLHPYVDMLTFTGSTATGKKLLIASGQSNMKRLVLECGGKAPNIVFEDAPNLKLVADGVVAHAFGNQGQVCTAGSRLLVQESVKNELLPLLVERAAALVPADPLKPDTRCGAVLSLDHRQKILDYVRDGERDGAKIVYQGSGRPPFEHGFYVSPTIFDRVLPAHRIAKEEIFGPVLSVISFRDEEEALRIANSTIYGLSAIVWTRDLGRAHRMTQGIRAGWVSVNATGEPSSGPNLGVLSTGGHKQSGIGVEGGIAGLAAYTSETAVQLFV